MTGPVLPAHTARACTRLFSTTRNTTGMDGEEPDKPQIKKKIKLPPAIGNLGEEELSVRRKLPPHSNLEEQRSLSVAVLGLPNAGKSTLVNRLCGEKVSIVSRKAQTTRERTIGVMTSGHGQVEFLDTPGVLTPHEGKSVSRSLVRSSFESALQADHLMIVMDFMRRPTAAMDYLLARIQDDEDLRERPASLVLNKIDHLGTTAKQRGQDHVDFVRKMREEYLEPHRARFDAVHEVSAMWGAGMDSLKGYLLSQTVVRPWSYHPEDIAPAAEYTIIQEAIREQLYRRFNHEIPYHLTQENIGWTPFKDGSLRVDQVIVVGNKQQKVMVLGKQGATIKAMSTVARQQAESRLGRRVHLFLSVRMRK